MTDAELFMHLCLPIQNAGNRKDKAHAREALTFLYRRLGKARAEGHFTSDPRHSLEYLDDLFQIKELLIKGEYVNACAVCATLLAGLFFGVQGVCQLNALASIKETIILHAITSQPPVQWSGS